MGPFKSSKLNTHAFAGLRSTFSMLTQVEKQIYSNLGMKIFCFVTRQNDNSGLYLNFPERTIPGSWLSLVLR